MAGKLTPVQARLLDANVAILTDPPDRTDFLHSVMCQAGLPRSRTETREFTRKTGAVSIKVTAGELWNGWAFEPQPLPYGTTPRLALIHISTEAVRIRSREVDIGDSMRQFLNMLGIGMSGSRWRTVRAQMNALAASRLTIGMTTDDRAKTISTNPIQEFDAWLTNEKDGQRALWPAYLKLSQEFYETLIEHAVPLDARALTALQHSALALDTYTWLAHRLCRITRSTGVKLSWSNLREQFGQEYRTAKDFKREMHSALLSVQAVYPTARIEDAVGGIILRPSPPPIAKTLVQMTGRHRG